MDRISFEKFRDVFRKKKSEKTSLKKTDTSSKKLKVPTLGKKFLHKIMDSLSKYSVEQEDVMGLDITSKAVRVAQLNNEKNKWILEKLSYKYIDVPSGLPDSKKVEIYISCIKEAVASAKISTINAAVSLPVSSSIIKIIQTPLMTDDEMERAIEHESLWQNLIQLQEELDAYSIFYQTISRNSKTNTMDILFVASKMTDVKAQVNLVKQAGLNPLVLDIRCFSLKNALDAIREQGAEVQKKPVALLEFGQDENYLLIMRAESPHITDVFINTQDKQSLGSQNPQGLQVLADRYAMQVKQAFAAYENKYKTDPVKDLFIVSSIQSIEKFVAALQKKLPKMIVQIFDPMNKITIPENLKKKIKAELNPSVFTSVIGLATRKLDIFGYYKFVTGVKNINLLPNREMVRKTKRTEMFSKLAFISATLIALFFIITTTYSYFGEMKTAKKELVDYSDLETKVQLEKNELGKINRKIQNIESKVQIGETINSNQSQSYIVLNHINQSVPKGIKLLSLNYDGNKKLVIQGTAKEDKNILNFITNLKKKSEIQNAIVKSMSENPQEKGKTKNIKSFVIDMILNNQTSEEKKGG